MGLQLNLVLLCTTCSISLQPATAWDSSVEELERGLVQNLEQYLHFLGKEVKEQDDPLTLFENGEDKLEGTFIPAEGLGIYFLSETDGSGKGELLITTSEGKTIFYVLQNTDELTLISISDSTLLYFHTAEGDDEIYRVPSSHLLLAQNAVQENDDFGINLLKTHLQQVSDEEGMACLSHILEMPEEIEAIIDAVNAMINEGLSGEGNNAAVRLFFAHALHLEMKLAEVSPGAVSSSIQTTTTHHQSESFFAASQAIEFCSAFPTICLKGRCPGNDRCFGMCGRGCDCWTFLCGDCCTHRGCIEHDICCRSSGFRAFLRCWAPLDFDCDRPFSC